MTKRSLALVLAICTVADADDPVVVRVGARLVQFNVVVQGKNGPIADLAKEEFTIVDRGTVRPIAVFHMDSLQEDVERLSKLAEQPRNVFANNQGPHNATIVLFDRLNTQFADYANAKQQIMTFLDRLKPDDRIGIYTLGQSLEVLHEFTSDSASLVKAIQAFKSNQTVAAENSVFKPSETGNRQLDALLDKYNKLDSGVASTNRVLMTVEAMKMIAGRLERAPGRKNLIWVSGAFPIYLGFDEPTRALGDPSQMDANGKPMERRDDARTYTAEIEQAARALIRANVAIYPVDARGILRDSDLSTDRRQGMGKAGYPPRTHNTTTGFLEYSSMQMLAERTGGKAFYNTNDISVAMRRASDDADMSYTLGFYLGSKEADAKYHEVKIKVARKGIEVRARTGYLALPDPPAPPKEAMGQTIAQALTAPVDLSILPITLRLDRADHVKAGAIQVRASVEPESFTFEHKEGKFADTFEVIVAQQRADGIDHRFQQAVVRSELVAGRLSATGAAEDRSQACARAESRCRIHQNRGRRPRLRTNRIGARIPRLDPETAALDEPTLRFDRCGQQSIIRSFEPDRLHQDAASKVASIIFRLARDCADPSSIRESRAPAAPHDRTAFPLAEVSWARS